MITVIIRYHQPHAAPDPLIAALHPEPNEQEENKVGGVQREGQKYKTHQSRCTFSAYAHKHTPAVIQGNYFFMLNHVHSLHKVKPSLRAVT